MTKQVNNGARIELGEPVILQTDLTDPTAFPTMWNSSAGVSCTIPDGSTIETATGTGANRVIAKVFEMHLGSWATLAVIN